MEFAAFIFLRGLHRGLLGTLLALRSGTCGGSWSSWGASIIAHSFFFLRPFLPSHRAEISVICFLVDGQQTHQVVLDPIFSVFALLLWSSCFMRLLRLPQLHEAHVCCSVGKTACTMSLIASSTDLCRGIALVRVVQMLCNLLKLMLFVSACLAVLGVC